MPGTTAKPVPLSLAAVELDRELKSRIRKARRAAQEIPGKVTASWSKAYFHGQWDALVMLRDALLKQPRTLQRTDVKAYLDRCIKCWRRSSDACAPYYVDAFQSVRASLFGKTVPKSAGRTARQTSNVQRPTPNAQ